MSRPVTILDKSEVLSGLFGTWDSLDQLLSGLSDQQWQTPTPLPGWSVHDVVAHMIGTESMLQGLDTPHADIDLTTLDHVRNGVGAANEAWVRHLGSESEAALLQRFRLVTTDRRERLSAMSVDDWNAPMPTPVGLESLGRFMRVRVFDCWMHEQDIRDAVGLPSSEAELSGPAARLSIDEIAATMGFVVGKLGKAPEGSRVAVELTARWLGPSGSPSTVALRWSTISAGSIPPRRSASVGCGWPDWPAGAPTTGPASNSAGTPRSARASSSMSIS
jgi:uncharacterized protein (TIGR03083 family)